MQRYLMVNLQIYANTFLLSCEYKFELSSRKGKYLIQENGIASKKRHTHHLAKNSMTIACYLLKTAKHALLVKQPRQGYHTSGYHGKGIKIAGASQRSWTRKKGNRTQKIHCVSCPVSFNIYFDKTRTNDIDIYIIIYIIIYIMSRIRCHWKK